MKFAEYIRCDGCGKMIPQEGFLVEDRKYCSKECYHFIQWYEERKAFYLGKKKRISRN